MFLKDFLYAVAGCYDIIFPWLNLLQDTQKVTILFYFLEVSQASVNSGFQSMEQLGVLLIIYTFSHSETGFA